MARIGRYRVFVLNVLAEILPNFWASRLVDESLLPSVETVGMSMNSLLIIFSEDSSMDADNDDKDSSDCEEDIADRPVVISSSISSSSLCNSPSGELFLL